MNDDERTNEGEQAQELPKLPYKQRAFCEQYVQCWNATEAARRAGYAHPNKQGPRLLVNVGIQQYIQARIAQIAMSADEVLLRLAEQARGMPAEYISEKGEVDIAALKRDGKTHLIHELKDHVVKTEAGYAVRRTVKMYNAQRALELLGKHQRLFVEQVEQGMPGEFDLQGWRKRQAEQRQQWDEAQPVTDEGGD